jgi:hypothetical protein
VTARWLFRVALLISLGAAAANADDVPVRVFHIGIVSGTLRSHPANVAFEDRLRELGYVEGGNLTIEFIQDSDVGRLAAAAAELAGRGFDVMIIGPDASARRRATTMFAMCGHLRPLLAGRRTRRKTSGRGSTG